MRRTGPELAAGRRGASAAFAVCAAGVLAAAMVAEVRRRARLAPPARRPDVGAATRARQASALLAAAVLADSTLEHYRARFRQPAMFAAPVLAGTTLFACARGDLRRDVAEVAFAGAVAGGVAGTMFHVRNLAGQPAAFSWHALFYGAPLGAPAALTLAGLYGLAGTALSAPERTRVFSGERLTALSAAALVGTSAEAALLHFRGAFQNPFMIVPLVLPPATALALLAAAVAPSERTLPVARRLAGATALMGLAGAGFHAWGIHRNMGGWRNWSQMLLQGPPLPAPPAFTGVALGSLGALRLLAAESAQARR